MAKPTSKKKEKETGLPDVPEQEKLLDGVRAFAAAQRFDGARAALRALGASPPQSLLLEGGSAEDRMRAALYWAALLNCPSAKAQNGQGSLLPALKGTPNLAGASDAAGPCLDCAVCTRLVSRMHRDLFFFDGLSGSIKIDDVREMRAILGEPPREAGTRAVILFEGQSLGDAAANSLLKSLEEPKQGTIFVLTAPQRERLLQTLVSRSWVLTLPWPVAPSFLDNEEDLPLVVEWGSALLDFAASAAATGGKPGPGTGKGWMERTARRGSLDAALAVKIVLFCQSALVRALSDNFQTISKDGANIMDTPMSRSFSALAPASKRILNEILAECQDSLGFNVNPALVMDWLATRLFFVYAGDAGRQTPADSAHTGK